MRYRFLIDAYASERVKVLSVWSMFTDDDLKARPHPSDKRGRSVLEHMVHQLQSEDVFFNDILGIDVGGAQLPEQETRLEFMRRYAEDSGKRLGILRTKDEGWWEEEVPFFDVRRPRCWIVVRRLNHTAHHRGQQTAMLRMLRRTVYSTYGPTADTGGLPANDPATIYPYRGIDTLLKGEAGGGEQATLPALAQKPFTERP